MICCGRDVKASDSVKPVIESLIEQLTILRALQKAKEDEGSLGPASGLGTRERGSGSCQARRDPRRPVGPAQERRSEIENARESGKGSGERERERERGEGKGRGRGRGKRRRNESGSGSGSESERKSEIARASARQTRPYTTLMARATRLCHRRLGASWTEGAPVLGATALAIATASPARWGS